jgi:hypothetical protein
MERAGVTLGEGDEDDGTISAEGEGEGGEKVDEERLAVFRDFINTLDLDDFDRKKGS